MTIDVITLFFGFSGALLFLAILIWSSAIPDNRLWPPKKSTRIKQLGVWAIVVIIFACAFVLGLLDWNRFQWPASVRWGIGLPLIVIGNWIVWRGVIALGMETTSGAVGILKTDGLYRYSRNPQYLADVGILFGWAILSASLLALPVIVAGLLILLIASLAEESWLQEVYGEQYDRYCLRTRRYL